MRTSSDELINDKIGTPAIHHPESNAALDPMEMKMPLRSNIVPAPIGLGTPPDSASASEPQHMKTPNRNKDAIASFPIIGLKTPPNTNNELAAYPPKAAKVVLRNDVWPWATYPI